MTDQERMGQTIQKVCRLIRDECLKYAKAGVENPNDKAVYSFIGGIVEFMLNSGVHPEEIVDLLEHSADVIRQRIPAAPKGN